MELLLCSTRIRDWVTVPSPSLAQEFGTICKHHYDKLFPLLLSKTVKYFSVYSCAFDSEL